MENLTYKDRLIIKAGERIDRLTEELGPMSKNSPQWHSKLREIGQEKEHIKGLRNGTVNIVPVIACSVECV